MSARDDDDDGNQQLEISREMLCYLQGTEDANNLSNQLKDWSAQGRKYDPYFSPKNHLPSLKVKQKAVEKLHGKLISKISGPSKMPLSNESISVKMDSKFFWISVKEQTNKNTPSFILEQFGSERKQIENHRNKWRQTPPMRESLFTKDKLAVYFSVLRFTHLFSAGLSAGIPTKTVQTTNRSAKIDSNLIRLYLSLESLNVTIVLKSLRSFLERFASSVNIFAAQVEAFFGPQDETAKASALIEVKEIQALNAQILDILGCLDGLSESSVAFGEIEGELTKLPSILDLYHPISSTSIGELMIKAHHHEKTEEGEFFRHIPNSWIPSGIERGNDEYNILDNAMATNLNAAFSLIQAYRQLEKEEVHVARIVTPIEAPQSILKSQIAEDYAEGYEQQLTRYNQFTRTKGMEDQDKEKLLKKIEEMNVLHGYVAKFETNFDELIDCLRSPPSKYASFGSRFAANSRVEDTWSGIIETFENQITSRKYDPSKSNEQGQMNRLLSVTRLPIPQLENILSRAGVIENFKDVMEDYKEASEGISKARGKPQKEEGKQDRETLMAAKTNLTKDYDELLGELKKSCREEEDDEKRVTATQKFAAQLGTLIEEFASKVFDVHDGPMDDQGGMGCMMIGMGQGGQQILRATLARLMNTLSDERSENMLKGLGIDFETLEEMEKSGTLSPRPTSDKNERKLQGLFDKASILAINLGPELEDLLTQPYSWIWGQRDVIRDTRNDKISRPAQNLVLFDRRQDGAGGKMGLGRAFASQAEGDLNTILTKKKGGRNITQIALIHSFAGGSGSGMILPILRKIKHTFPTADVWVFSAGEQLVDDALYGPQNVVYITSDVLQSHYNALHHAPLPINNREWRDFKNQTKQQYTELDEMWKNIKPWFPTEWFHPTDVAKSRTDLVTKYNRTLAESIASDKLGMNSITDVRTAWEALPQDTTQSSNFDTAIQDVDSNEDVWLMWQEWVNLVAVTGGMELETSSCPGVASFLRGQQEESDGPRYLHSYAHFRAISRTLNTLKKGNWDIDAARQELASAVGDENPVSELMQFGLGILETPNDESNIQVREDVIPHIQNFARRLRHYQEAIYRITERILINRGALNDRLIKHVIVSNSHLDAGTKFFNRKSDGDSPTYEVYNSTMVEVFINLVHGLVNEDDDETETSSTFEVMDVSDLRRRTRPVTSATLLELENTSETCKHVRYVADYEKGASSDYLPLYDLFDAFFTNLSSPIYDQKAVSGEIVIPKWNQFYIDYFNDDMTGLVQVSPKMVVDLIREEYESMPWPMKADANPKLVPFYESLSPELKNEMDVEGITLQHVKNMYEWIRLVPLEIIEGYFLMDGSQNAYGKFEENTKEWQAAQTAIGQATGPLSKENRSTRFQNFIRNSRDDIDGGLREELANFFIDCGLMDSSHLAAYPSSMLYDIAPWILSKDSKLNIMDGDKPMEGMEMLNDRKSLLMGFGTPGPCIDITALNTAEGKGDQGIANPLSYATGMQGLSKHLELSEYVRSKGAKSVTLIRPTAHFIETIAEINISASQVCPEFASYSVFDQLVSVSSNPRDSSVDRLRDPAPRFEHSHTSFGQFARCRPMYRREPVCVRVVRTLLLSPNKDADYCSERELNLRGIYLGGFNKQKWYESVHGVCSYPFDNDFTPTKLDELIEKRSREFIALGPIPHELEPHDTILIECIQDVISEVIAEIDDDEQSQWNTKAFFNRMMRSIKEHKQAYCDNMIELGQGLDRNTVGSDLDKFEKFFALLESLTFVAYRQHRFLTRQMEEGEGVSFTMQGTLDGLRSSCDDFLAVCNTSTNLAAEMVQKSIKAYYTDFANEDGSGTGKTFMQRLSHGPLASITLLSQHSAALEVANNFKQLMDLMEKRQFDCIYETLVHPYSFLRNTLWLSTFRGMWLKNGATQEYSEYLDIPDNLVRAIFGSPGSIHTAMNSVIKDGDMKGLALSKYDSNNYAGLVNLRPIDKLKPTERAMRRRQQVHIPDMLMLNYIRVAAINEANAEKSASALFNEKLNSREYDPLPKIYPRSIWYKKFENMSIMATSIWFPSVQETASAPNDLNPIQKAAWLAKHAKKEYNLQPWKDALSEWHEYLSEESNVKMLRKQTEADDLGSDSAPLSESESESNVEPNESSTEEIPEDDELSDIESILDEVESSDVPDMVDLDE